VLAFVFLVPLLMATRAQESQWARDGIKYEFSEAGVGINTPLTDAAIKWAAFAGTTETRSAFWLYSSRSVSIVLPKRCFTDVSDIRALRELLREMVPKAKLLRD
jgi:hypothetical protein